MSNNRRLVARASLLSIPVALALGFAVRTTLLAQPAPAADTRVVADYADQITRFVQNGKIDDLTRLNIPSGTQTNQLRDWTEEYLSQVKLQEKQRDKQYSEAVTKAQDLMKADRYDKAMGHVVLAYRIAKDPEEFLKLPWVVNLTDKVAARAADLEKQGQWLESLQLYSDLNTLYEVSVKFKPDAQRLTRRTRLLAVYTPKTLLEIRKKLIEKQADPTDPKTTTKPADDSAEEASFTRWQDYSENVTLDMARRSLEQAEENWVENTNYDTMVKGGVDALRLFLTTPELSKEFPGLADANARKKFSNALDAAAAASKPNSDADVADLIQGLVQASDGSVKLPKEVVIMEFTDGAIEKLDPFTAVIWPHEVPEFEKQMDGHFGGVGIQISLEGGQLKVISPLEDTPAYRAGIEAGDLITAINGKSTVGISVDQAVNSIMGSPDTVVNLKIKRGDQFEKEFPIKRAIIKVTSIKGVKRDAKDPTQWDYMLDPASKIGYVRITGFQADTAEDLKLAIRTLKAQGMRGLVLDLRFNPGGLLSAAVDMCDDFLDSGTIVSTRGRSARAQAQAQTWKADAKTEIPMNMPMIVLVNEYSASASEIFSGAMKDLHRAYIIGHRTFGKGSVQNLLDIGNGRRPVNPRLPEAMMKLTMQYYYLPNGENLHRRDGKTSWGVDPDINVDLTPDQLADLLKQRRDNDIIRRPGAEGASATPPKAENSITVAPNTVVTPNGVATKNPNEAATNPPTVERKDVVVDATGKPTTPATKPATEPAEQPAPDTQLETALLMMRLQLVQSRG